MSGSVFCRHCGASINELAPFCPKCGAPQRAEAGGDGIPRTFGNSIKICWSKYADFSGRAPRAEYWYWTLFAVLLGIGAALVAGMLVIATDSRAPAILRIVVDLVLFLPGLAVQVRRLHDLDKTGWWLLLIFIPVVGWIILLVWWCTQGTRGPNQYGPDTLPAGY
jgi:uncharacterized membrane protein YhaH (DUF805 family)